jgi:hypothetical protein
MESLTRVTTKHEIGGHVPTEGLPVTRETFRYLEETFKRVQVFYPWLTTSLSNSSSHCLTRRATTPITGWHDLLTNGCPTHNHHPTKILKREEPCTSSQSTKSPIPSPFGE